jgi:exonuclease III
MRSPLHTSSPNHQENQRSKFPHNRNIRFATINFQSINAKKHSFWNVLDSSNPDIICGNETWLKPSICNSEILPDESDYEIFRKDRKDGFGGVMLAIKSNINSNPIDIATVTDCDCEIIARKIECDSNNSLIVISAYRPPNSSIEYSKGLSNIISDICHKNTKSTIWIGGDLNLPDINWSSNTITSNQYRKEISEIFLALEEDLGLIQSVNFPTRDQHLLDVFFTNRPSSCTWT